ncbi:MAG: hypothetical protein AB1896_12525 [Thermodesulfobacteriota bacterium]
MSRTKILVLVGPGAKDLKSVHYALALAERLEAQVLILRLDGSTGGNNPQGRWLEEVLADLSNSARQAGLSVFYPVAGVLTAPEIVNLVREEGVEIVVFDSEEKTLERSLRRIQNLISSRIVQVKEKDQAHYW